MRRGHRLGPGQLEEGTADAPGTATIPEAAMVKLFGQPPVSLTATTWLGFPPDAGYGPADDVKLEVVLTVAAADARRVADLPAGFAGGMVTAVVADRTSGRRWVVARDREGTLLALPHRAPTD